MPRFVSYDGTVLAYHVEGAGEPLVCLPGGPAQAARYLGDLGGLTAHRRLVRLDIRGSGESAVPADPASYRCDRLVADVEALRVHLGLERMDLLGHSAGASIALLYAIAHPQRLHRMVLVTPSLRVVGIPPAEEERRAAVEAHAAEPWYADAHAALTAWAGGDDRPEVRLRAAPFFYGRWDDAVAAHAAAEEQQRAPAAAAGFYAEGAPEPEQVRAGLAGVTTPVLVLAGARDPAPAPSKGATLAAMFPNGRLAVDPTAAHFPWLTDGPAFVRTVTDFLR